MSENCTRDCANCTRANCNDRKSFIELTNPLNRIKKVIGVVSGKGGVGKSMVTGLLAVETQKRGVRAAVLDADITGPSIPRMFGISGKAVGTEQGVLAKESITGIKVMSINLLLENESAPVIWRGPVISGVVKQFWKDVIWGNIEYMFVDMPPGTGDVPLTVFQSIPLDGVVIVATPQGLVSMIVEKAMNMAKMMNIPILGIVENMSYVTCPKCGEEIRLFGESHVDKIAVEKGIPVIARLPLDADLAAKSDEGKIEQADTELVRYAVDHIQKNA